MKRCILLLLLIISMVSHADFKPFCSEGATKKDKVMAYIGADTDWNINNEDLQKIREQLEKVTLVNYSFVRFSEDANGNIIPKLSAQDIANIKTLRQLKPDLPILLAVGGWGDRQGFSTFVKTKKKRAVFIKEARNIVNTYQLDGMDIDWENELLATTDEINGVASLMVELKQNFASGGYCVSNAVPGTAAYWKKYPKTKLWANSVDWTMVMAYDNYGTFGSKTEHGAALYDLNRKQDKQYPYPTTSGDIAVNYYYQGGLPLTKIVLGIPFYCHSYYVDNAMIDKQSNTPGLHVPVLDPNINSQISYQQAWSLYGEQLFAYQEQADLKLDAVSYYGLIPLHNTNVSRFISCDSPRSIASKVAYVKGKNSISEARHIKTNLGGVAFWSLQQDLKLSERYSLLRAINESLSQAEG